MHHGTEKALGGLICLLAIIGYIIWHPLFQIILYGLGGPLVLLVVLDELGILKRIRKK